MRWVKPLEYQSESCCERELSRAVRGLAVTVDERERESVQVEQMVAEEDNGQRDARMVDVIRRQTYSG